MSLAALGMYPFEHLRPAYDSLWSALRDRLGGDDVPAALDWNCDVHESWTRPDLVLGQACGWPLVTQLDGRVAVVGAFDVGVPQAEGGRYRSVLVAQRPRAVDEWRSQPDTVVAVNSLDSLSGWVSLCAAWGGRPLRVMLTGAHRESLRAVAEGSAHLASLDAVSFVHLGRVASAHVAAVHVVGHGPEVPSLPLICAASKAHIVPALRAALDDVVADPQHRDTLRALCVRGFVPFGRAAYDGLLALAPPAAG